MSNVFESIVTRFDADSLIDDFPGNIWLDVAGDEPEDGTLEFPFIRMVDLGDTRRGGTSGAEMREHAVQFSIFWKENGVNDPYESIRALFAILNTSIRSCSFLPPDQITHTIRPSIRVEKDPSPGIWHGMETVEFRTVISDTEAGL